MNEYRLELLKLLVVGKTGAGKSEFCNFLFGKKVFESAAGKPVTEGIQEHQFKLGDTDVIVYDTEGIEVSNAQGWEDKLDTVIRPSYKRIEKIHGIFYLINASSARIEDFEIDLIKKFSNNYNMPVFVVLTHKDIAKPEQISSIKLQLKLIEGINFFSICTIQKNLRGGRVSVSNEELKEYHIKLITLFQKTSGRYYLYDNVFKMFDVFEITISNLRRKILREISDVNFSIFNITEWEDKFDGITENLEKLLESFEPQLEGMIEQFKEASDALSPHVKSNPFEDIIEKIYNSIDINFEIEQIKSLKSIQDDIDVLENGEFFVSKLGAGITLAYKSVTAESTMKEIAEDGFELLVEFLDKRVFETKNQFNKESWVYINRV